MTSSSNSDLRHLAWCLGNRFAIEKALIADIDTQAVLDTLVNIEPPALSIEFFVKLRVRDCFTALIRLSESTGDLA